MEEIGRRTEEGRTLKDMGAGSKTLLSDRDRLSDAFAWPVVLEDVSGSCNGQLLHGRVEHPLWFIHVEHVDHGSESDFLRAGEDFPRDIGSGSDNPTPQPGSV